jgi:hypothetical protein
MRYPRMSVRGGGKRKKKNLRLPVISLGPTAEADDCTIVQTNSWHHSRWRPRPCLETIRGARRWQRSAHRGHVKKGGGGGFKFLLLRTVDEYVVSPSTCDCTSTKKICEVICFAFGLPITTDTRETGGNRKSCSEEGRVGKDKGEGLGGVKGWKLSGAYLLIIICGGGPRLVSHTTLGWDETPPMIHLDKFVVVDMPVAAVWPFSA